MKVAALLASMVLGNRLLDPMFLGGQTQGGFNPFFFDGDAKDMAMYNYFQQHPQGGSNTPMNQWMMNEMDAEDFALYQMMHGQGGANAPIRAQSAGAAGGQMNPQLVQALLQSDMAEDLMDNEALQRFFMAKQMQQQGQQQSGRGPRGKAQGFGDFAQWSSFGQQPSTTSTFPQYMPGMDAEEVMQYQMMQQMNQQNPGSYNPALMADWDLKEWSLYNMMNQQGTQNTNSAMWMDGDMGDYMMWQSIMNSKQPASSTGPRGNAIEQMQKMALCQTYLNSMTGTQAQQMQAYTLYAQAEDIGEDDIRRCLMMHQMQTSMSQTNAASSTGFDFGSGFGRTLPDPKDMAMMAWMNKNQGEGQGGLQYYPGMDAEDMLEFNFWQKMKEQVANKQQQQ